MRSPQQGRTTRAAFTSHPSQTGHRHDDDGASRLRPAWDDASRLSASEAARDEKALFWIGDDDGRSVLIVGATVA